MDNKREDLANDEESVRQPEPHWSALSTGNMVGMLLGVLLGGKQVETEETSGRRETDKRQKNA